MGGLSYGYSTDASQYSADTAIISHIYDKVEALEKKLGNIEKFIEEAREEESWEMIDKFLQSFKNT